MLNAVIVEDELNIRDCLEHLFPWDSLNVKITASFSNGQDAFRYVTTHSTDFMLIDIQMPEMSGLELVKLLRDSDIMIPVIILTGYKHIPYMQQAIRYHVNDFLFKPIKFEELSASILRIKDEIEDQHPDMDPEQSATYYSQIVQGAINYIKQNLSTATLESTAVAMNLSAGYFSKIFHKEYGKTFSAYLIEQKMNKARELLNDSSYKMYEIALLLGYDNPKNFTRTFKSFYGISPMEYRKTKSV